MSRQIETIGKINHSPDSSLSSFKDWQRLFIYFWVFSVVGQLYEFIIWRQQIHTLIPFAPPYGFGAIALIIFVIPIIKQFHINHLNVFIISAIIGGIVEYICAFVLVMAVGHNNYWDYSNRIINFDGYTCLEAMLAFGAIGLVFIYFQYPYCEKILKKLKKNQFNNLFWLLFALFIIDTTYTWILK